MAEWTTLGGGGFDYVQTSAPSGAEAGESWLDTSANPPVSKVYTGSSWTQTAGSPDASNAEEISKEHYLNFLNEMGRLFFDRSMNELNFTEGTFDTFVDKTNPKYSSNVSPVYHGQSVGLGEHYGIFGSNVNDTFKSSKYTAEDITFKEDETKAVVVGETYLWSLNLGSRYDFSSSSTINALETLSGSSNTTTSIAFGDNGNKYYEGSYNGLREADVGTAYDISTLTEVNKIDLDVRGIYWKPDGTKLYVASPTNVHEYDVGTPWDIGTLTEVQTKNVDPYYNGGIDFKDDGTKVYLGDADNDSIALYELSIQWDISTASKVGSWTAGTDGLSVSSTGKELAYVDAQNSNTKSRIKNNTVSSPITLTWTKSLGFTPSEVVVSHTTKGDLTVDYTIEDSVGNSVTVTNSEVDTTVSTSALQDGDVSINGEISSSEKTPEDVLEDFAVYFN